MGGHNPYRSRYYTTHSHDLIHGSRVWSDGVQIAGACNQADAETICALLNRWVDIHHLIGNVWRARKHNRNAIDASSTNRLETDLYMQAGLLESMTDSCDRIRQTVDAAINHIDDPTWENDDDDDDGGAWQEARTMAGMAHGNRGLADYGGLEHVVGTFGSYKEE